MIFTLSTSTISFYVYIYIETYPISDNESTTDSIDIIDTNIVKLPQGEFNCK
jgi:hypothetical protein